ncbi:hypothetical protein [Acidovorax sp. Root217]|uniref:hypothetical protein n=1 Tax=Acidovorax sp. Root217 TaxID=1736492 RepID=UPI00070BD7A0|nr:hypothetical protein [Acidovorax sp. Root217]KRC20923.1 hypothetical protein ASE31_24960 [Acidovorax sp. Root217]
MKLSPYFYDLRSAYQAELDDLTQDSEGKDVLRKRLTQKRSEIAFLVQMMELAPEMVAVVFHQGFRFARPAALESLIGRGADDLPAWGTLADGAVLLEPWAASLAKTVLAEPGGERFMAVAAGLEYLQVHSRLAPAAQHAEAEEEGDDEDAAEHDDDYDNLSADDAADPHNARSRDEASDNWLSDVGFDRKD